MKISYNFLNTFFGNKLPSPEIIANELTFHSWEIEEVVPVEGDTMIDVKVLPDKSAWALSHRGIAKDLAVILNIPLTYDPFLAPAQLEPIDPTLEIHIETDTCTRYTAALIRGVKVGPSPEWLVTALKTLGQRSINNIVDITNYVMFETGQPLHAFDAGKLSGTKIVVRNAKAGETITTLTGETYTLSTDDALIVDGVSETALGIGGIKGGKAAEVGNDTVDVLIECAHFRSVPVRKTSQRLRLRTDASSRYENGIVSGTTVYGLTRAIALMLEHAGGTLVGYQDTGAVEKPQSPVSVSLEKIRSVLGLSLTEAEIKDIARRFGYEHTLEEGTLTIVPPFERTDLNIGEDLIEEIGRIHGYADMPSKTPSPLPLAEINKRFYYSEMIRDTLTELGFSEIYTSSFRNKDEIQMANAFASDKGYLRSSLRGNMHEALLKNIPYKDLLGISFVGLFEIGTVFKEDGEFFNLALGVRHGVDFKEKVDTPLLTAALEKLKAALGTVGGEINDGIAEFDFGNLLPALPDPQAYVPFEGKEDVSYEPFSPYPPMSRDIAFWVHDGTDAVAIEQMLKIEAGELCVRLSLFDEFSKEGRTSYAFRLVFQSYEKTLTDETVNAVMDRVYQAVLDRGYETR